VRGEQKTSQRADDGGSITSYGKMSSNILAIRVEPDPMADDLAGETVVLVARGLGRRGHAWRPIHRFMGSLRGHRRRDYVMAQEGWSTT